MRVVFRADASRTIGSGHIARCLTLARMISDLGGRAIFVCREAPGELTDVIRGHGFPAERLPVGDTAVAGSSGDWLTSTVTRDVEETLASVGRGESASDWIVVDHYGIGAAWESVAASAGWQIAVIDDLADRAHGCRLLVDQTFGREPSDYSDLVPPGATVLAGSRYALLRPEFEALREELGRYRCLDDDFKILVNFGGVDPANATLAVAERLLDWMPPGETPVELTFVVGRGYADPAGLRDVVGRARVPTRVLQDVPNMGELMASSHLAIGAGGTTSWERCCLALPTIVISIAENQRTIAENLHDAGAILHLGTPEAALEPDGPLLPALHELVSDADARNAMATAAAGIADGRGARRVADHLFRLTGDSLA